MYKICVFVPIDHSEKLKNAMFQAGAGRIGYYDHCCFELEGTGQFRPLEGSAPFVGRENKLERVRELRLEMVVDDAFISQVVCEMKKTHPYETPAYDVIKLEDF